MFEHIRSIALVAGLLAVAACGGGDSGSGGGGAKCTNGMMSSPGIAGDPCTAAEADCTATGGTEMALCTNGSWGTCTCVPGATGSAQSATTAKGPTCGDGVVTAPEMCETGLPSTYTMCSQLMPGSIGLLNCTGCKYDTSLCTMMTKAPTGGSGAATGGTGAMSTGGTGARK